MNYFQKFKDIGVIDKAINSIRTDSFETDNNCEKSMDAVFGLIDRMYMDNVVKGDLKGFIMDLRDIYKEVGVNLGSFFYDRHFKKKFRPNSFDTDNIEMKMILDFDFYIDIVFGLIGEILLEPGNEHLVEGLYLKIYGLKRDLIMRSGVPEGAINFVLNSTEVDKLIYFTIKTGFKCGFLLCLFFNPFRCQLNEVTK